MSEERRRVWKAAINRADIQTEEKWNRTIICSKHFVGGIKAYVLDRANPSWSPTLFLGSGCSPNVATQSVADRYKRASGRKEKKVLSEVASTLLTLKKRRIEFPVEETQSSDENTIVHVNSVHGEVHECKSTERSKTEKCMQTDLTSEMILGLEEDLKTRLCSTKPVVSRKELYLIRYYDDNPDMVSFYTGIPTLDLMKYLFQTVCDYISESSKVLTKEEQFLMCLIKLRMNYLFKDISNQLDVSISTIQRAFHDTLDVLYKRLKFLVRWPEREALLKTMPMCFRKDFGRKVVVVMDCFELFTEKPSGAENKVTTYSHYKHHQTVKYLIGVAPQGVVTFISEGFGGRASDKFIAEQTDVLDNLLPGDIVMTDRGFSIEESVNFFGAELAIPSFTKRKLQLHPLDVEKTRKIASVRIHVERVIGLLLRKFRIFEGVVPLEFLKLRQGESIPTIDKIVTVTCSLVNLCASVVPSD